MEVKSHIDNWLNLASALLKGGADVNLFDQSNAFSLRSHCSNARFRLFFFLITLRQLASVPLCSLFMDELRVCGSSSTTVPTLICISVGSTSLIVVVCSIVGP